MLQRLMPSLDLALRHRMIGRTADVVHVVVLNPVCQLPGDVARAVVREGIEDGRQIEPAPTDDLEIGEVSLP